MVRGGCETDKCMGWQVSRIFLNTTIFLPCFDVYVASVNNNENNHLVETFCTVYICKPWYVKTKVLFSPYMNVHVTIN